MAAYYIKEIHDPTGGALFSRRCLHGGQNVFEMAQQLHAQGQKVAMLVLFDTYGPESLLTRVSRYLTNLLRLELKQKLTYVQKS